MGKKCGSCGSTSSCGCKSSDKTLAQLSNKVLELQSLLDEINDRTSFLQCGSHPILMLSSALDISLFGSDGIGTKKWAGWALCDGQTYPSCSGGEFTTSNLIDKFVVGAGGDYEVGDTGGLNEVTLVEAEMPEHLHAINDPGHDHELTDPGHTHAHTQEPHTHAGEVAAHSHGVDIQTSSDGSHEHETGFSILNAAGTGLNVRNDGVSGNATSSAGVHTHDVVGTTDSASPGLTIEDASIDIENEEAFTGIIVNDNVTGITMDTTGDSQPHENRPPFLAVVFIQKL